ncbi:hypothetical protein R1flu_013107 [Riccia fluitans]|uniref:Uncharacterized protein n=1 Tax=Riccia fluitans TaxID=41844 RepID=A0ABD1ZCP4_9MARC
MAPRNSKGLKTKEVKIPHLTIANKKKMETWGLGGLFAIDWNETYEDLVEELAVLAPVRPEHFQHNLLTFYHYAWVAIKYHAAPTPDWRDAVEKTMSKQIKALRVCNEATCLGPYLAHLYSQFHEMDNKEKEDSKKRKALIQTVFDSDTEMEDDKEPKVEIPHTTWEGEASGSKLLEQKTTMNYHDWGVCLKSFGWETSKLFKAFHVEVGSMTMEAITRNMEQVFAPPPVMEVDIQPWKEMVKNLIKLLT